MQQSNFERSSQPIVIETKRKLKKKESNRKLGKLLKT